MAQHAKTKDVTYESQRKRIEKMMENPDKLMDLPNTSMDVSKGYKPPDFVRNVMGSSAGAGSGEFHVYRHLRRKEMTRLKEMEESSIKESLDRDYKLKLEEIKRRCEMKTVKKKEKRLKKKEKLKFKRKTKREQNDEVSDKQEQSHEHQDEHESDGPG